MRSYREYVCPDDTVLEIGASGVDRTRELSRYCGRLIGLELLPERTPEDIVNIRYVTGDWQNVSELIDHDSIDVVSTAMSSSTSRTTSAR